MTLKKILEQSDGSSLVVVVKYDNREDVVTEVKSVYAQKGTTCIDITEIFMLYCDEVIDKINWREEIFEEAA